MLRWVLGAAAVLFTALLAAAIFIYLSVRSAVPAIPLEAELTETEVERLRALVGRVEDPRKQDGAQTLTLSQDEIDALVRFASARVEDTGLQATATAEGLRLQLSRVSPFPRLSPFIDVEALVSGTPRNPELSKVRVGRLPIPDGLVAEALTEVLQRLRARSAEASELLDGVEALDFGPGGVTVRFRVTPELARRLERTGRGLLTERIGSERLQAYHEALGKALERADGESPKLAELVSPLFELMKARDDPDPKNELRVAFLVAAFYVVGRSPSELVDVRLTPLPRRSVRLWGRTDLPKHFLVSAFVAAWGDRALADAVGLSKEVSDAEEGGSGFSFVDLAADRAGTQLVERGLSSASRTQTLIRKLAAPDLSNEQLLPDPRNLPEGLSKARLEASGRAPGSPGHERLIEMMDARLETTSLHRALLGA